MERKGKLNILEPWEHGTEKSLDVAIIKRLKEQYLLHLSSPISIRDISYSYLLFKTTGEDIDLFLSRNQGTYPIEIVYTKDLSEESFSKFDIADFRSSFLFGEIILE